MPLYFNKLFKQNEHLKLLILKKDNAKLLLTCLYLSEGGKTTKGSLMFGNSDPLIIKLFIKLLNIIYKIDKDKFRCTLQCRADQNTKLLKKFWSKITGIPPKQFYKPQIDKRSLGKRTLKKEYKGVCRIDYFSAEIFHELTVVGKIITE